MATAYHLSGLLEKMGSQDKDYRFMATNDLLGELKKDSIKLDDDSEKKIVRVLLKLLEDPNGEVQNLAVHCLGPLVLKVKEPQIDSIAQSLCIGLQCSAEEQMRGICGVGIKNIIMSVPVNTNLSGVVCKTVTPALVQTIAKQDDVSVKLEALEILAELITRFGGQAQVVTHHDAVLNLCIVQMCNSRSAVRKRSISVLGSLVACCSSSHYTQLVEHLIQRLQEPNIRADELKTCIQCLATISMKSKLKIGHYLAKMVPLMAQFCEARNEDDELREHCLQAFDTFVRFCPKEMRPFLEEITRVCLILLVHDPNYCYDEDDTKNGMDIDEHFDLENSSGTEEEDFSDDDDVSWKVRRASARCISAVISNYADLLPDMYDRLAPSLIKRFVEREENVKEEVFRAVHALLRQTRHVTSGGSYHDNSSMEEDDGAPAKLLHLVPAIVQGLQRQLRERSMKTRKGCFCILHELAEVLQGCLVSHISALLPGITLSLRDKNSINAIKVRALAFINVLLSTNQSVVFHVHMKELIALVVECMQDSFSRIVSESLKACQKLARILRPLDVPAAVSAGATDNVCIPIEQLPAYCAPLLNPVLVQLKATDRDAEVKERAIACSAQLLHSLGDVLMSHQADRCTQILPLICDRLSNEVTRLSAVRAIGLVATSPLKIDMSGILSVSVAQLSTFLRKKMRSLRLDTLYCLVKIWSNYSTFLSEQDIALVLAEIPVLICDTDLGVAQAAVTLCRAILLAHGQSILALLRQSVLPPLIRLIYSPQLHGASLDSVTEFLAVGAQLNTPGVWDYEVLLGMIYAPMHQPQPTLVALHRDSVPNLARCLAEVVRHAPADHRNRLIQQLIGHVRGTTPGAGGSGTSEQERYLSLLTLGEVGRVLDISGYDELITAITEVLNSHHEEMKTGAAVTLGKAALGNLARYIPFILQQIHEEKRLHYFMLHSLREVINSASVAGNMSVQQNLKPHQQQVWALLIGNAGCAEEGPRNLVSECLGRMTLMEPVEFLPRLREHMKNADSLTRCTIVTAVKFALVTEPHPVDALLRGCIGEFLCAIHDPDLVVRRAALVTFNTAAHNKAPLIKDLLEDLLPALYAETAIREELIKVVRMGPFEHKEDQGLDLRKVAFECMYTLLDCCLDRLNIFAFLVHVERGLKDVADIKTLTYLMLARLSLTAPGALLQRLEQLLIPVKATLQEQTKDREKVVKQEIEKQEELKRAALRAVATLSRIPDIDKNRVFVDFVRTVITERSELSEAYDQFLQEQDRNASGGIHLCDEH